MAGITGIIISMTRGILITTILAGITGTVMHSRQAGRMATIISTIRFAAIRKLLLFNPGSTVGTTPVSIIHGIVGTTGVIMDGILGIMDGLDFLLIVQTQFSIMDFPTFPAIMITIERV